MILRHKKFFTGLPVRPLAKSLFTYNITWIYTQIILSYLDFTYNDQLKNELIHYLNILVDNKFIKNPVYENGMSAGKLIFSFENNYELSHNYYK